MPRIYLYPEARRSFATLPSQTVATLERSVAAQYRARRYEVVWTCAASLPTFRYPVPFPLPNQAWTVAFENNAPMVSVRLGDKRMKLRLKGSPQFRRQRSAVEQMVAGEAVRGELAIYRHRSTITVKLVSWLPRSAPMERCATLAVKTQAKRKPSAWRFTESAAHSALRTFAFTI